MNEIKDKNLFVEYHHQDQYLGGACIALLNKIKAATKENPYVVRGKRYSIIRSPVIILSHTNLSNLGVQCKNAVSFISEVVLAIKIMGFDIKLKELRWINVMDSCDNITGDRGRFYLTCNFKKKKIK